ncbi:MAG: phosphotyrosine protein phosphatase [Steroidobacteraceae bacterium]
MTDSNMTDSNMTDSNMTDSNMTDSDETGIDETGIDETGIAPTAGLPFPGLPFTVLHICLGNICRSPMAERLLAARFGERLRARGYDGDPTELLRSHSAGTGDWHVGDSMNPGSALQLANRGVSPHDFRARQLARSLLRESQLVLTATAGQALGVSQLEASLVGRVFPLLRFGRVSREVLPGILSRPGHGMTLSDVRACGEALIRSVAGRLTTEEQQLPTDDLTDPFGESDLVFSQIADEIEYAIEPLVSALAGAAATEGARGRTTFSFGERG